MTTWYQLDVAIQNQRNTLDSWVELSCWLETRFGPGNYEWWFLEKTNNYPQSDLKWAFNLLPATPGVMSVTGRFRFKNKNHRMAFMLYWGHLSMTISEVSV